MVSPSAILSAGLWGRRDNHKLDDIRGFSLEYNSILQPPVIKL